MRLPVPPSAHMQLAFPPLASERVSYYRHETLKNASWALPNTLVHKEGVEPSNTGF